MGQEAIVSANVQANGVDSLYGDDQSDALDGIVANQDACPLGVPDEIFHRNT